MSDLPKYEKPPVVELVCGILFETLNKFLAPHMGLLWENFKNEYPNIRQMMPLAPVVEPFDAIPSSIGALSADFPLHPRVWFESKDGTGLIQVQRDRFLYNWKKVKPEDKYLHYDYVIGQFKSCLLHFESFLKDNELGEIKPVQYELTYVNHIPKGQGWNQLSDVGTVFPDISWRSGTNRFLSELEGLNVQTSFKLPERQGRLHAAIRYGIRQPDQPILLLELTCRGIGNDRSRPAMWEWFDLAHEWIVRGFADFTSAEMQKSIWRRSNGCSYRTSATPTVWRD
jgi:uncharacterized protein (TIGR04255 family)